MRKEQLHEYYRVLKNIHEKFCEGKRDYKYGSNLKIRNAGLRKVKSQLTTFEFYVNDNPQLFKLIIPPKENWSGYDVAIRYDEFKKVQYFANDMDNFLKRLQGIIEEDCTS